MRAARFLLIPLFLFVLLIFKTSPAFAQETNSNANVPQQSSNSYTTPNTEANVPQNLHTYSQSLFIDMLSSLSCQITGVDPTTPDKKCLGINSKTGQIGFVKNSGGAILAMGSIITTLYTPPADAGYYVRDMASNFGFSKKTLAAGTTDTTNPCSDPANAPYGPGFCGLKPILGLWTTFRNLAYLIFVLIFMVIGIAIMLRVKIDPRTVMTIENQIPKIIVGLVMVTFSYAIAGFMIDVMYGSIYLSANLIASTDSSISSNTAFTQNIAEANNPFVAANIAGQGANGDVLTGLGSYISGPSSIISSALLPIFQQSGQGGQIVVGIIGGLIAEFAQNSTPLGGIATGIAKVAGQTNTLVGALISGALDVIIGVVAYTQANNLFSLATSLLAFIILAVALLWALFRLWFALIAAYIFLLMDIIFAPFWVIAGLLPGSPISFGAWIRDMAANLAVFPITIVMFVLAKVLMDATVTPGQGQFVPPLVGIPIGQGGIAPIIGLGIILTTPEVLKLTKAAFKAPKINLQAMGQAVGIGAAFPSTVVRGSAQTIQGASEPYLKSVDSKGSAVYGHRNILGSAVQKWTRR